MRHLLALCAVVAAACGSSKPPEPLGPGPVADSEPAPPPDKAPPPPDQPPGDAPKQELLAADTPKTTGAGVTYTAPAGWKYIASGQIAILETPEPDTQIAIVDALGAKTADEAVQLGWKLFKSGFKRTVRTANDLPGRDGWDSGRNYQYEVSPNERRTVVAIALRKGDKWTVVALDAATPTLEKRGGQLGLIAQSIRPAGHAKESFKGKPAAKLDAARLKKIDAFVELGMRELGIPGASIAIVQDGKVIHARGFGVRELGKKPRVDANTLFIIASNTKAMTTLLLAQLVDDKRLRWDQKVTEVFPDFKLGSAETTGATQIKHLVCACTGLPRKDLEWLFEFARSSALSTMGLLASTQPTTKFGEAYQYSNLLAAAAGYVAAHVIAPEVELGKAYDDAMRKRIFVPLGMKATTFDFKKATRGNHARPHSWDIDSKTRVGRMDLNYSIVPMRPAGGAWSSANDLIRYVQMELAKGVGPGGKRVVSEPSIMARREPQTRIGETGTYGMGLSTDTKYDIPVVDHGGSMLGYKSNMMFLPDHGVGAVILTNSDLGQTLLDPFQRYLLEQLFDGKPEAEEDVKTRAKNLKESAAKERAKAQLPPDPAVVKGLAARYENASLGAVAVSTNKQGQTVLDFGEWRSSVASRKNEDGTVSLITIDPGGIGLPFVVGTADGKRTLTVRDAQHEYVFTEKP